MEAHLDELRKFVAPEFIFGTGAIHKTADYIRNFGAEKVLLVSDPGVGKAGWSAKVEKALRSDRIPYVLYDSVSPNPRDSEVMEGAECFNHNSCDMVVVIGGGSPMDCAKGIGIVVSNRRSIGSFEGVDNVPLPMPPLLCLPTTAGTGADVSQFAIILDTAEQYKMAIVSKGVVPDISLIDPRTTLTMNSALTAETGMDALTHAVEAYVSNAASPVTDIHALHAIEYLVKYLPLAAENPSDTELRAGVMMGSLLAGMAFSNASLGLVHAMAHALGGLMDLPHGLCNALLLEEVVQFNYDAAPQRYRSIAQLLAGRDLAAAAERDIPEILKESLTGFRSKLDLPSRIDTAPVDLQLLTDLSNRALKDACLVTNPKRALQEDISGIFRKILP